MKKKMLLPVVCLIFGVAALISALVAPVVHPIVIGRDDPGIKELRAANAEVQAYTAARTKQTEDRLAEHRWETWTEKRFNLWAETNVRGASGWVLNDLGVADFKHIHGHRYAFQRVNATADNWPAITKLLQTLEGLPCASVESATLTVGEGISGSRHFSQCLFVAVFYFDGDDA